MIDGHSHLFQDLRLSGELKHKVEELEDVNWTKLFLQMDLLCLEKIVTLTQEMTRISKSWLGSNDLAIALQRRFPRKIVGVFGAEPLDDKNIQNTKRLKEFKLAAMQHEIKGLLFTPPYGHFYANDKTAYPFYEVAVENDVTVYFHHAGGEGGGGGKAYFAPLKYARPLILDDVVIDFPDLRINVEHMGYPWTEELLSLMKHAPNVFTDITQLLNRPTLLAWYLVMAKEYDVIDRVFWGSDYVGENVSHYFKCVEKETTWIQNDLNKKLKQCGWPTLTRKEIDGILNVNVRKLLRL